MLTVQLSLTLGGEISVVIPFLVLYWPHASVFFSLYLVSSVPRFCLHEFFPPSFLTSIPCFWCILPVFFFFGLLGSLPCPSGLLFCSVLVSSFSVPYLSLSIPSRTAVRGSSLPAPSPSRESPPSPPFAFTLCLFACYFLFLSETQDLPWNPTVSVCCRLFMFSILLSYLPMR